MTEPMVEIPIRTWHGCYDGTWRGLITDESFAHPAKFSPALIERIYDYMIDRGWLCKGDVVGDPFGGIAGGAIHAAYKGLRWIGVELEARFVELGRANIELHRKKWEGLGDPVPMLVQGDSRFFARIVGYAVACACTSPPYISGGHHADQTGAWNTNGRGQGGTKDVAGYGATTGQIGQLQPGDLDAACTSPPYANSLNAGGADTANTDGYERAMQGRKDRYGHSEGQIGDCPTGEVGAVVSSPPYAECIKGDHKEEETAAESRAARNTPGGPLGKSQRFGGYGAAEGNIGNLKEGTVDGVATSPPFLTARSDTTCSSGGISKEGYARADGGTDDVGARTFNGGSGEHRAEGNIETLPAGDVDGVTTSPPWMANCEGHRSAEKFKDESAILAAGRGNGASDEAVLAQAKRDAEKKYGDSEGQIGRENGETYWQAMRKVYEQCFLAIKPGGVMACIVKDYINDKKRVRLCDDTLRLLVAVGFTPLERVHAMLTRETTTDGLFGTETKKKDRKSFFRRLAEKKGAPRIDEEEVIFVRKPQHHVGNSHEQVPGTHVPREGPPPVAIGGGEGAGADPAPSRGSDVGGLFL